MNRIAGSILALSCAVLGCAPVTGDETSATADETSGPTDNVTSDATAIDAQGPRVDIDRVIDGDSLEVVLDGEQIEVRLLAINAPELFTEANVRTCNGIEAKGALQTILADQRPIFVPDEIDRFGRQLAEMVVDDGPVAELMIEQGWALGLWIADDPHLIDLMQEAALERRGMWGDTCGAASADQVVISDHRVDAAGDDRENLDDEWIELTNDGSAGVDLTGWMIKDETSSNRFLLDGVTLDPGESIRVRSGPRPSGVDDDFYIGGQYPVWSNRGETVLLLDPEGVVVDYSFIPD